MTDAVTVPEYDDELYELASPGLTAERLHALVARANALLPDSDPRKLTWEMVDALRARPDRWTSTGLTMLRLADILELYLPPRQTKGLRLGGSPA